MPKKNGVLGGGKTDVMNVQTWHGGAGNRNNVSKSGGALLKSPEKSARKERISKGAWDARGKKTININF